MTKALPLARSFHSAGHRVVLVEARKYRFTGHRFSRAVDALPLRPRARRTRLRRGARRRSSGGRRSTSSCPSAARPPAYHDARAARAARRRVRGVHVDPATVAACSTTRTAFAAAAAALGLPVPDSHRITDPQQVDRLRLRTRAHLHPQEHRLRPGPPAGPHAAAAGTPERRPPSRGRCRSPRTTRGSCRSSSRARSTARTARCATGACSCTAAVSRRRSSSTTRWSTSPRSRRGSERFVEALGSPGQVSFDFIESADGDAYAIECNPRTHSAITMFYDHPEVARAYLDDGHPVITPASRRRPTYWIYHEIWRLMTQPGAARRGSRRSRGARTRSSTGGTRCRT